MGSIRKEERKRRIRRRKNMTVINVLW